jgi:hypothetical protein
VTSEEHSEPDERETPAPHAELPDVSDPFLRSPGMILAVAGLAAALAAAGFLLGMRIANG